jgi:micrococcal nuclease
MKGLIVFVLLGFSVVSAYSQTKITAQEASKHIGDSVTVFDKVYGVKLLDNGMTLLNMGAEYPNHLLVVMIKSEDKAKFAYKPEEQLNGKQLLVTGKLIDYKGKAQIVVTEPYQIIQVNVTDQQNLKEFK